MGKPIPTEFLEDADKEPNSALSYLDIVTAAFGAAIFLLFVFATLPLDRAGGAGAETYIDVHVSYTGTAVIEVQLEFDGKMILRTLEPSFTFDPRTGAADLAASPAYQDVLITNKSMADSGTEQLIGFRILGPAPGAWVVYANAAESAAPFSATAGTPITLQVETACAAPCVPDVDETRALLPAHAERQTLARIKIPES